MEFKDYYATLGVAEDRDRQGDQAGVPEAGAQAPSRRQPGRQGGRGEVQGDQRGLRGARRSREAQEVRRARRQLAAVRTGAAAGPGLPGGAPFGGGAGGGAWNINMGGPGGYRTMTEEEMHEMFGERGSVLRLLPDVLRRRRRRRERRRARGAARAPRTQKGRDIEQEVELTLEEAYHGATRRHLDQARRPRAHRRRAHSRRASRTARACAPPARANRARRRRRPAICICASGSRRTAVFERKGDDLYTTVAVPVTTAVLGGEAQVPTITGSRCG